MHKPLFPFSMNVYLRTRYLHLHTCVTLTRYLCKYHDITLLIVERAKQ